VGTHFRTSTGQLTTLNRERQERAERLKQIELYRDNNIDMRDKPFNGGMPVEWKNGALPDKVLQDLHSGAITWDQAVKQYAEPPTTADLSPEWMKQGALADKVLQDIRAGNITWDQALRTYTQDQLDQESWNEKTKKKDTPRSRLNPPVPPGDVGWFTREGPLVKEFYEGARNLKPGGPNEIGGPVRTEFGFHLIKMLEVRAELPVPFDQCMDKVEKAYIEYVIQNRILPVYSGEGPREPGWLDLVTAKAAIVSEPMPMSLWPPRKTGAGLDIVATAAPQSKEDPDPVVARVNGVIIHRSDVWRELLRYDSEDALNKLIHREMVLTMLKPMGIARMDWECGRRDLREQVQAPPLQPIDIGADEIDRELQPDLYRLDAINTERKTQRADVAERRKANPDATDIPDPLPDLSFADYIYRRYGRSMAEYRRSLEASAVLMTAVRKKVPVDVKTLKLEFSLASDAYTEPSWFEVSHIQVVPRGGMGNVDKIARQDALSIASGILQQCNQNPERFEALVAEHTGDEDSKRLRGLIGACYADGRPNPNQIHNAADRLSADDVKSIYSEIKKQNVERGHFTSVIATSHGFHIIRVDAVHPERKMDFKEALPRLIMDYLNEFAKVNCDIWLKELEIEHKARIKRFIGEEKHTLEIAHDDIPDGLEIPKPDPPKKK
jgi:parvulin-like peptidyl-prolyl isomerase